MERQMIVLLAVLACMSCVTARWLPTRSNEDRLDKLREMLKDLLQTELEKAYNEQRVVYKREIGPASTSKHHVLPILQTSRIRK